jgi:hypothetical protein
VEVRDDADLGTVLSLLLQSPQGRVAVVDAGGSRLGTLTPSALHAAVQPPS